MRSPADRVRVDRVRVERVLRAVGLAAVAVWILLALRPQAGRSERATTRNLPESLDRWTRSDAIGSASVHFDTLPDEAHTAWLRALQGAGVPVHWSLDAGDAVAAEVYPAADPAGGLVVLLGGDSARRMVLGDALGPIDTTESHSVRLAGVQGDLTVGSARQRVSLAPPAPAPAGRILVVGTAGWESKFAIAALEEAGWLVSARLAVGPDAEVVQGSQAPLDTARYAAVVLMDSAAAERARGVERFVRSGGGVVLVGDASRASQVAGLTAWRALSREVAPLGSIAEDSAWRGNSRVPFTAVANRSLVLERRAEHATLLARRHFTGRVLAVGYDQSWRWRMTGGDSAVAAHRAWWSSLAASVALRPAASGSAGAAPLARVFSALGDPSRSGITADRLRWDLLARLLAIVALASLTAEWFLRRARGGA